MERNNLLWMRGALFRVLAMREDSVLLIDCLKQTNTETERVIWIWMQTKSFECFWQQEAGPCIGLQTKTTYPKIRSSIFSSGTPFLPFVREAKTNPKA